MNAKEGAEMNMDERRREGRDAVTSTNMNKKLVEMKSKFQG